VAVEIVQALWTGEPVTYSGRFATLDHVVLSPRPVRPRLKIWLGGSSPAALNRMGRIADGWVASRVSPEAFATVSR
jgi:alkanesulfonate monooxygenase SsuD/methylene tetrahydromethanopterin reductase-like flavin-dependent oxidoreductase (luciferase family)